MRSKFQSPLATSPRSMVSGTDPPPSPPAHQPHAVAGSREGSPAVAALRSPRREAAGGEPAAGWGGMRPPLGFLLGPFAAPGFAGSTIEHGVRRNSGEVAMGRGLPGVPASHPPRGAAQRCPQEGSVSLRTRGAVGRGGGRLRPPPRQRPVWPQRRRQAQEPSKDRRALFEDLGVNMK